MSIFEYNRQMELLAANKPDDWLDEFLRITNAAYAGKVRKEIVTIRVIANRTLKQFV